MIERARARENAKVRSLQLERHGGAGKLLVLEPGGDLLRGGPQPLLQRPERGKITLEGVLRRYALALALGVDRTMVDSARQPVETLSLGTVAAHEVALVGALQVGDQAETVARKAELGRLADAVDERHRFVGKKRRRLGTTQHGETARLVEIGGNLGQELVGGKADRNGDAEFVFNPGGKAGERSGRAHAVQALGARQVHEGLVDRNRFDQRGQLQHQRAHLPADGGVFFHVRADHGGLRTQA